MEESNPSPAETAETSETAETTEIAEAETAETAEEPAEKPIETIDISEDTELIKEAQADLSKFDVLVCGGCHEVFHIIEEFQNHKTTGVCTNVSTVKCENDGKSQAWGFALWKSKQRRILKENSKNILTSWEFYQRWTKLDQTVKELWISAGRNLQFCNKIASGKLAQSPRKNSVDKDPLALDEEPQIKSRTAVRTKEKEEEYNVEKIVGKRYNPRKKHWEYEVKWENYEIKTWEPLMHLENCKSLVNEYELNIKLQKEKEKEKLTPRGRGRPRVNPGLSPGVKVTPKKIPTTPIILNTSAGRPQRSCKQKALNQVKAWCGNISDGEEGGIKRPFDDDDSDDSFEKKIKLGGVSDSEDDEPKLPIRKVAKIIHTYNNGSLKSRLPDNVLIPDAKGVVRISQKQLPSLSSGVYIMSKSSGIIKLDPAASKIATSGGQAIVKLSPKIGQTQIKIIKKEDGSKRVIQVKSQDSPKVVPKIVQQPASKPTLAPLTKTNMERILKKVETPPQKPKPTKVLVKEVDNTKPAKANNRDEESDDGIEEFEFPSDLPLPSPESPPGEFILDPTTGKVAGLEYPEPAPAPEAKAKETPSETLDNIVKLAAADITEDDLQPDMDPLAVEAPSESVVTTSAELKPSSSLSILSAAIVNSNILQKTLLSSAVTPSPKPKTQPRIITSTPTSSAVKQRPTPSIIRTPVAKPSLVRPPKSAEVAKPKFNIAPMNPQAKNVYSNSNNIKKRTSIGNNNSFYKANQPTKVTPIKKKFTPPPKQVQQHSSTPRPIISMPSLDEDTSSVVTTVAQVVMAPKVPEIVSTPQQTTATSTTTDLSTFTLQNDDKPVFITADDGTVYQVAGQNEEGQTILLTQDGDGQQCLVITNDPIQEMTQQQQQEEEVQEQEQAEEVAQSVLEPLEISEEEPLVAQFIRTEPLSPGGTHKVVVMLPDGDVMVTQVTPEEYASLELDK